MEPNSGAPRPPLPSSVRVLHVGDAEVYLVGTAHVSRRSVEDVRDTIEAVQPDTVCVELCPSRFRNLIHREEWKRTNIVKIIRDKKAMLLLSSLIMTSFQRRIARQLGITPGAEMVEGIRQAERRNARLVLADRDIQVTLKRTWGRLRFWNRVKMMAQLVGSLFFVEKIDEETIEEIKKEEKLAGVLELLADEFPTVKSTLIDERDIYLAQKIKTAEGKTIVAVVGAGHVPGILREMERDTPLEPLLELPRPSLWPRLLQWGVPALVLGMIVYGFFQGGARQSMESIAIWVVVNGTLSALGALLALGHPATVLAAFLAAPLTSLNPMIAAGWVSGLVQAFVKRPTVEDLEDLADAITTVTGFWRNPVSRILLVVVLSNVGSMLGTFIGGSWITARSLS